MRRLRALLLHALIFAGTIQGLASCSDSEATRSEAQSTPLALAVPPLYFVDITATSGLAGFQQLNGGDPQKLMITDSIGAGVAFLDYDRDGHLDVYLTNGATRPDLSPDVPAQDALYAGDGGGRFEERTQAAGLGDRAWTSGVQVADLDGDGWRDLYLTNHGPNVLYLNREGRFEDVTEDAGVGTTGWSTGAVFLDHDLDGDLDLYVANYIDFDFEWMALNDPGRDQNGVRVFYGPNGLAGAPDAFYVNAGAASFHEASREVGIAATALFGLGVATGDVDVDGWPDVYVANDSEVNLVWRNTQGRFEDVALRVGLAVSIDGKKQAGMGLGLGDYDTDGFIDIYVTNFAEDYFTLYRGDASGFFTDVTQRVRLSGPTLASLGWGCGFVDFDSDGDQDLFAVNGHVYPQVDRLQLGSRYDQPDLLFENDGAGRFRIPTGGGGPGFASAAACRGAATGDFDRDGDIDLLIGVLDGPPRLLRNDGAGGGALQVQLEGKAPNLDAFGARIVAHVGERRLLRLIGTGGSFLSSSEPLAHFGLGTAAHVEQLTVTWPDGSEQRCAGPWAAGTRLLIRQGQEQVERQSPSDG